MSKPDRPSTLERYLLGVLGDAEMRAFEARFSPEQRAAWAAEHAALQSELLARFGAAPFAERVKRIAAAEAKQHKRSTPALPVLGFAALLACVGVFGRSLLERSDSLTEAVSAEPTERAKGLAPGLRVYRKTGSGSERLREDAVVQSGDVLQLGIVAPGMRHGVVLALDGAGQVTQLFPSEPEGSTRLPEAAGEHLLDLAYELDEAPGFERFVLVTAASDIAPERVLAAARKLAKNANAVRSEALPLAPELSQTSFLLRKGAD